MKWRLLLVPPSTGAENMARDNGLMDRARETGESVFSVYSWKSPTLSFGRNQTAAGKYDLEALRSRGMGVVRRPTGGRALFHNREVTYSVTSPIMPTETLNESYDRINGLLLEALFSLGVDARVAAAHSPALPPGEIPCFATPSKGELVSGGKKLVGSAQVREGGALLQHGSILIEDDQAVIADVSLVPPVTDAAPAATLSQALGRAPSVGEIADALFAAVVWSEDAGARRLMEADVRQFTDRHIGKYQSELWTWRR